MDVVADVAVALAALLGAVDAAKLADFCEVEAVELGGFADVAAEPLASTLTPPVALSELGAVALGFDGLLLVESAPPGAAEPEDAAGV